MSAWYRCGNCKSESTIDQSGRNAVGQPLPLNITRCPHCRQVIRRDVINGSGGRYVRITVVRAGVVGAVIGMPP